MSKKIETIISDIDDVIKDFKGYNCDLHNKIYGTSVAEKDLTDWDYDKIMIKDAVGTLINGADIFNTFKRFENCGLYSRLPVIIEAKRALELAKFLGYKIILLTSRDKKFGEETYQSLIMDGIPYDELIFDWDKAKVIKNLSKTHHIRLFADDKLSTIKKVNEQCKIDYICLVNKAHNQEKNLDEDIIRVNSLFDCIKFLKNLNDKK
jgi:uncharacterized HAD superfamily protein